MFNHNVCFNERIWQTYIQTEKPCFYTLLRGIDAVIVCQKKSFISIPFSPRGWASMAIFKHVQDTTAGHILLELAKARIVQCHLQR